MARLRVTWWFAALFALFALFALLSVAGCGSTSASGSHGADDYVGVWLPSEQSEGSDPSAAAGSDRVFIRIEENGKITLSGTCNVGSAAYTVDDAGLHVDENEGESTAVLCLKPDPTRNPTGPLTLNDRGTVLSEPTAEGTLTFVRGEPTGGAG